MLIVLDDSAIFVYNLKPSLYEAIDTATKTWFDAYFNCKAFFTQNDEHKKAVQYGQNHQIVNKVELSLAVKHYI